MAKSDKQRALEAYLASTAKKYGEEGAKLANSISKEVLNVISTGSALLDEATGVGGLPRGRVVELFGDEGSGKTSLAEIICGIAQTLYEDEYVGWVDVEHAMNWEYAQQLGMKKDRTIFVQPSSGEQALDEMLNMISSGAFSVVVLDSVGGLATKAQIEKEIGELTIGEVARLMSNNVKKITDAAGKANVLVIFINQLRVNIGAYGSPAQTMGGKALRFFASVRIQVKKKDPLVNKMKDFIGQAQEYVFKKNRMGVPFKTVETEFFFGKGFNIFKEMIDIAIDKGLIAKGGAWFYPNPADRTFKFQGKDAVIEYYAGDNLAFEQLRKRVRSLLDDGVIAEVEQNVELLETKDE